MPNATVLVVDDEPLIRWSLVNRLKEEGYRTLEAGTAGDAVALHRDGVDLVLLDFALPDANGLTVAQADQGNRSRHAGDHADREHRRRHRGRGDEGRRVSLRQQAVRSRRDRAARREGARNDAARREVRVLRARNAQPYGLNSIVGDSGSIKAVRQLLEKIGVSPASTVLLTGESGTGKDLAAKVIHYSSNRAPKPFMNITCSALPETLLESELFGHERGAFTGADRLKRGLIESADGGTVFLDEIGEMVPLLQAKLLRFLEEKSFKRVGGAQDVKVDVRVVAATNRSLQEEVKKGRFREDLYYRLNVMPVALPPLRDRKGDIALLIDHYVDNFNTEFRKKIRGVSPAAMAALQAYRGAATCASFVTPWSGRCCSPRATSSTRATSRCCRRLTGSCRRDGPAGRGHQSRGARTFAGGAGARTQRLEPDQGRDAAWPEPGSDPLPHRKVRSAEAVVGALLRVGRRRPGSSA